MLPPHPPLSSPPLSPPPHHPPQPAPHLPRVQTRNGVHLYQPPKIHVHFFSIFNIFNMHSPLHFIHTVHCTVHTQLNKKYGIQLTTRNNFCCCLLFWRSVVHHAPRQPSKWGIAAHITFHQPCAFLPGVISQEIHCTEVCMYAVHVEQVHGQWVTTHQAGNHRPWCWFPFF